MAIFSINLDSFRFTLIKAGRYIRKASKSRAKRSSSSFPFVFGYRKGDDEDAEAEDINAKYLQPDDFAISSNLSGIS